MAPPLRRPKRLRATAALEWARRAMADPEPDRIEARRLLQFGLGRFARTYLRDGGYSDQDPGTDVPADFFHRTPSGLAFKVAVLTRRLRWLEHRVPAQVGLSVRTWSPETEEKELRAAVDEVEHLIRYLTERHDLPVFRGEDPAVLNPGAWVRRAEYDCGRWSLREGRVLAVRIPDVFVRFRDQGVEAVDVTGVSLSGVAGVPGEEPDDRESRRSCFDMFLADTPGLRPSPRANRMFGSRLAQYVATCPCCGYPTRWNRFPQWRLLGLRSPAIDTRCALCDWSDVEGQDDGDAAAVLGGLNGPYSLAAAREAFESRGSMYAAHDAGERAEWHRGPARVQAKRRVRGLFDGMRELGPEDVNAFTAWRAACGQIERLPRLRPASLDSPAEAPPPAVRRGVMGRLGS